MLLVPTDTHVELALAGGADEPVRTLRGFVRDAVGVWAPDLALASVHAVRIAAGSDTRAPTASPRCWRRSTGSWARRASSIRARPASRWPRGSPAETVTPPVRSPSAAWSRGRPT